MGGTSPARAGEGEGMGESKIRSVSQDITRPRRSLEFSLRELVVSGRNYLHEVHLPCKFQERRWSGC